MSESIFEERIAEAIRESVLKELKTASFVNIPYADKHVVPQQVIEDLWKAVKWDEVIEEIRPAMQTRICNAVIGAMEKEIKTDVKSLMSIDGVRQKLRVDVYPALMKVLDNE